MRTVLGVRLDMPGFKRRQSFLSGDRASSRIRVGDFDTEGALTEARADRDWRAIAGRRLGDGRNEGRWSLAGESGANVLPQYRARWSRQRIPFSGNDVLAPVRRHRNPLFARPEEWLYENRAANLTEKLVG